VFRLYTIKINVTKVYIHVSSLISIATIAKNMKQAPTKASLSNPQEHIQKCEAWTKNKPHEANINYEQMLIWIGYDFRNP
jgi:hypothetical protein